METDKENNHRDAYRDVHNIYEYKESSRKRPQPHLIVIIVLSVAVIAGYVTFMLSFCGQLICDLSGLVGGRGSYTSNVQDVQNIKNVRVVQSVQNSDLGMGLTHISRPVVSRFITPKMGPTMNIGDTTISLELATTTAEQVHGLSDRTSLPAGVGMWFVFSSPTQSPMWMKDMNFPLDMIWVDQNMKIVHIATDLEPSTYPEIFYSDIPASYVLEVNAGFVSAHHVVLGNSVVFMEH